MDQEAGIAAKPDGPAAAFLRRTPGKFSIDTCANLALLALVILGLLLQLFVWPFLLERWGVAALWFAVPFVVLAPTHWGLIHEGVHGQLLPRRRLNESVARGLAIAYLLPFDAVRFGHLMHHRFTREPYDCPDVHDGATHPTRFRLHYYSHLLGGLYVSEVMLPVLAFLSVERSKRLVARAISSEGPKGKDIQRLFVTFACDPARRSRIRRDWLLSLGLHLCVFYLYGAWWPALAMTMYLRGTWLSLADNLPHYDVSLDEPDRARNFRVPRIWQRVLMNHHLHQLHHQHPTLPWTALPGLAREVSTSSAPAADSAYFRAGLRQFRRLGKGR